LTPLHLEKLNVDWEVIPTLVASEFEAEEPCTAFIALRLEPRSA